MKGSVIVDMAAEQAAIAVTRPGEIYTYQE